MSPKEIIEKAIAKYKCLQEENFYIEWTGTYVKLYWHTFMDTYIDMRKVYWVGKFLRRYTDLPIYNSYGPMDI